MQGSAGYHGRMRLLTILLVIPLLAIFAIACNGDDDGGETPTSIPSIAAPTDSPTAEASATTAPQATDTPAATDTPQATDTPAATNTPEPGDGTVFPENPGSTDPFPIKSNPDPAQGTYILTDVRVGAHPESGGWDRIVFEFEDVEGFAGAHPAGMVEYVDEATQCASGMPVDVEGASILAVRFDATQAHEDGNLTIDSTDIDGPGNSILQAVSYCDFEGVVQWAIGVPSEQNYKVAFLENPSRVVIDVKWP